MRLLLIEDSQRLLHYLAEGLRKSGHTVDSCADGRTGLWQAQASDYDVIILDIMLPSLDGLSILTGLRKGGNQSAVLILTARNRVEDRVHGLRAGADDYLAKPFEFDELVARIEALFRRRFRLLDQRLMIHGLTIDIAARTVSRNNQMIELTQREYALLEFLALRRDRVHSRAAIEACIRDDHESNAASNVVDAAVYALRRKIDRAGEASIIVTRRGMGYTISTGERACPSDDE